MAENRFRTPRLEKTMSGRNWMSGSWKRRDLTLWSGAAELGLWYGLEAAEVIQGVARRVPDPGYTHHVDELPEPCYPALVEWLDKMVAAGRPYIGVMFWEEE